MGNSENEFLQLPSVRKGVMKDHTSKFFVDYLLLIQSSNAYLYFAETDTVAVVDSRRTGVPSIFHVQCCILLEPSSTSLHCMSCTQLWKSLASLATRAASGPHDERTHPSSHTPYTSLTT